MTRKPQSLPASGGSYTRAEDGGLIPADTPAAPPKRGVQPPVKSPVKPPSKED